MSHLIRTSRLDDLYEQCAWPAHDGRACDLRLAEFIHRNLAGSDYTASGYASVDDVLTGDIAMIRRFADEPASDPHLYALCDPKGLRAFILWYALQAGGPDLLPPAERDRRALTNDCTLADIAYGDWLIVDTANRVRGLGGVLFAIVLDDMAQAGYRAWYGRTVVPGNRELYETLYRRTGRAELVGEWQDGPVTRIGFLGDLRGGWTKTLLDNALRDHPGLVTVSPPDPRAGRDC